MARRSASAQCAITGLTHAQENQRILELRGKGLTLQQIGQQVGLGTTTVKYRLDELLHGKKRVSVTREMCEGCWEDFPAPQLDGAGLCSACRQLGGTP